MGLKVGKYGVNSGNTFRVGNTRYLRQYGSDSCIMRRSIPGTNDTSSIYDTGLGDSDLKCDGVLFSLNKKGRWSLPELIKNEIINGDHRDDDFGIQLVERHKIAKEANCISVCSTKNNTQDKRRLKTKRYGYLHANSVLKRRSRFTRRERRDRLRRGLPVHGEEAQEEEDEEEPEPTQVRYDVLYPSPPQSALAHNLKSIKYESCESWNGWHSFRRRTTKHRRTVSKKLVKEAFDLLDEKIEDSEEEIIPFDTDEAITERSPITLADILEHTKSLGKLVGIPSKVRRKSEEERRQHLPKDTKGRIYHLEKASAVSTVEQKHLTETAQTTKTIPAKSTVMEPVMIVLPFEQITPTALRERFGPFYVECECFPRKFALDISDQVSSMDKFKGYKKHERTVNACLVITMCDDNEMNTLKDSVCKVVLNTNFCDQKESVKIETIFDYMDNDLDELIERILFFMEILPDYSINMNISEPSYTKANGKQTNLEEFAHWSTDSYQANDEYLFKYFTSFAGQYSEVTEMGYEVVSYVDSVLSEKKSSSFMQEEMFCGICYEIIGNNVPATALISCGHWFCDCCWREHLTTKITSGSVSLPCPEYDCEKNVDPGTALSFVTMPLIMKHAKHRHDTQVERLAEKRWCPNERCRRVLQVNSLNVKTAKCQCGEQCCVDCLGKPHWPADCDSVRKFQQLITERGDSGIVPVEAAVGVIVNGKNCPNCNRFVEKYGGCPYMSCVCGKAFCWGCGKPHDGIVIHYKCHWYGNNDKHGTIERNIDPEDKLEKLNRRRWYKMALVHRVGQHPVKYQNMKVAAKALCKKFNAFINRTAHKNMNKITVDFHVEGKVYARESDKTSDFLNAMIDLYREASFLVENVAVLIDSQRIDNNELNSSLQYMAARLAMFVNIIYDLFVNEANRNVRETMDRMQQARNHARTIIRALVKCVSREQI